MRRALHGCDPGALAYGGLRNNSFVFALLRPGDYRLPAGLFSLLLKRIQIDPPIILAMTSPEHCPPISMRAFRRWVASAARRAIAYYHGYLILDRSPGSSWWPGVGVSSPGSRTQRCRAAETGHV